jgi:ribonuclease P protein subunit POP4
MMPITEKNILRHELIGLDVEVVRDSNISNISLRGRVFDETRNTLLIKINEVTKRIAKQNAVFRFKLPDCTNLDVDGRALIGRPEDRVKRKMKRGW